MLRSVVRVAVRSRERTRLSFAATSSRLTPMKKRSRWQFSSLHCLTLNAPHCSITLVISPCLPGLPEPVRAGLDHCLARTCDALESGELLTFFGERFKPTLDFQVITEARTITIVNVVVADRQSRPSGSNLTSSQRFPARVVQHFHRGRIVQMMHEIDLGELHHC